MTKSQQIGAFFTSMGLPPESHVDQRVPKKLLLENGALTAADKRQITEGIEEIHWLAALKPNTVGVPEYRDEAREYLEIAVLSITLRGEAKAGRLAELVHRAVPYPVFLILVGATVIGLSLAHKRWAQNEAGKVVLEGGTVEIQLGDAQGAPFMPDFRAALALAAQPRAHLLALYQGWIDTLLAYQVAGKIGRFARPADPERAVARRQALRECQELEARITALRSAAGKERQLARQMELNLEIKRVQGQLAAALAKL